MMVVTFVKSFIGNDFLIIVKMKFCLIDLQMNLHFISFVIMCSFVKEK